VKLFATAETMAPTQKNKMDVNTAGRRPKIFDNDAKLGWKTIKYLSFLLLGSRVCYIAPVEQSRNEVPAQKASMAVPLSSSAMIYNVLAQIHSKCSTW
jgi:hypothetical protein